MYKGKQHVEIIRTLDGFETIGRVCPQLNSPIGAKRFDCFVGSKRVNLCGFCAAEARVQGLNPCPVRPPGPHQNRFNGLQRMEETLEAVDRTAI